MSRTAVLALSHCHNLFLTLTRSIYYYYYHHQNVIAYFLIQFQGSFRDFYLTNFVLALTSTAYANALGAAAGANTKLATQSLPMIMMPQLLFAGFFVTPSLIPVWIRWVQYICPLTYGIRILLLAEFGSCAGAEAAASCTALLEQIDANEEDVWWYWIVLLAQFAASRLLALWLLRSNAQRFY